MRILFFWCDKYLNLKNYNCNLAGEKEFLYNFETKTLIGENKNGDSEGFFNILDESQELIPIEISAIVGINGIGKTTTLKIISEILSNKGSTVSDDYKINYILIYEINDKKYIIFEDILINKIIMDNKKIPVKNSENDMDEYNIKILSLGNDKTNIKQNLEYTDLKSVATLFISNTYEETCNNFSIKNNSFNLSNHYLLKNYLSGKSDLFKVIDFRDRVLNLFDFWQMELLSWDIEFMCSTIYEKLIKDINLVSPKYLNVMLDYVCDTQNIFDTNVKRFNNKSIEKFSFEQFIEQSMGNSEENTFFSFLNQRICDLVSELILSERFIKKDKIIEFINEAKDFKECSSIIELLENIVSYINNKKDEFISEIPLNTTREMENENKRTYSRIKDIILAALNLIQKIEKIKNNCDFEERHISKRDNFKVGENDIIVKEVNIPILTKEINRLQSNKKKFEFLRELVESQSEFYSVTKMLPFYIEANGISSGQKAYLSIFSKLFKFSKMIKDKDEVKNIVILIDELDIHLHPEWKRKLVYLLTSFLKILFNKKKYAGIHVIMTTNEPYILSDIPKNNTILLDESVEKDRIVIKKYSEYKTLGANIIDLLDDAFFLSDGNKGEYITEVIKYISKDLNNEEIKKEKIEDYMDIVKLIEEPLIQKSLIHKLSGKLEQDCKAEMIEYYEQLIKTLKDEGENNDKDTKSRKK